jgi:hypothetical protein
MAIKGFARNLARFSVDEILFRIGNVLMKSRLVQEYDKSNSIALIKPLTHVLRSKSISTVCH